MPGLDFYVHPSKPAVAGAPAVTAKAATKESEFGFDDLLDIVNPLQHFPVISTIYKHLTGDKIGVPEKILGDTLYGGLMGLASSVGDALFTELTGKSVGDTIYDYVMGDDNAQTGVASAADKNPVAVKPASSDDIALPSFSFLDSDSEDETPVMPSPEVAQRATQAYRNTGKYLSY